MVAREGFAPSISGCRPDVMLFHHQAYEIYDLRMTIYAQIGGSSLQENWPAIRSSESTYQPSFARGYGGHPSLRLASVLPRAKDGCRGWNCTSIRAFKGRCPTVRRPGNKWWPARVTRPVLRIKSPLHHFNACRPKIGSPSRSSTGEGWCSWQDSHLHWRRSRRRASSGWATRAD